MRRVIAVLLAIMGVTQVAQTPPAFAVRVQVPGHQNFPPRPGGTPFVIGVPTSLPRSSAGSATTSISLTPRQIASATTIARHDSYVRRLLAGHRVGASSTAPWLDGGKHIRGALVQIRFARPATVSGQWLALPRSPYQARYRHVVALRAFVDLDRREVVGLVPTTR